jgi:hypothetical protein
MGYAWRIAGGLGITYAKMDTTYATTDVHDMDVHYTSFIDHSNHKLCFDLQELLLDSQELKRLRLTPQPYTPSFVKGIVMTYVSQMSPQAAGLNSSPRFKHRERASWPARPASGSREFRSTFNAKAAAGASPRAVSIPSEVRREHVGMRRRRLVLP